MILSRTTLKPGSEACSWRISTDSRSGMPELIIVDSCRVMTAMSLVFRCGRGGPKRPGFRCPFGRGYGFGGAFSEARTRLSPVLESRSLEAAAAMLNSFRWMDVFGLMTGD